MDFNLVYNSIIKNLENGSVEIQTVPITNRNGIWFSVEYEKNKIFVYPALHHTPSSRVQKKIISKRILSKMYLLYVRRENGEQVSLEAKNTSFVQVYCYGIFKYLGT